MTNGDRIRAMTDEELADEMFAYICKKVPMGWCEGYNCRECRLKWLKEEANDG
jgi:hypothetical protein